MPLAQVITFSGIDGAGKSTQIDYLSAILKNREFSVIKIAFWDDVAVFPALRSGFSTRVLRQKGGPSDMVSLRSDKNVRTWYLSLIRAGFYVLDAWNFRRVLARLRRSTFDFIIVDRCCYDQLVHVRSNHWLSRAFIRLVLRVAPKPDVPLLLDVSAEDAFARKPEYPLNFMREYRQDYLRLRDFVPDLALIGPAPIDRVRETIERCVLGRAGVGATNKESRRPQDEMLLRSSP